MPKSYRIRTEIGQDKYVNVKLEQDFEQLEILSLKINESDIYTRVCSDYGVIVGRVLVNGGFGVPNAKVSVFIPLSDEDELNPLISELYPYKNLTDLNEDGYRYNLLPKDPSYTTHAATGTFPTRDEVLLEQSYIEVYDKYYKFTVKTNESGDYMIFGVPTGTQTIVMDVDLSDIGCFSLTPQDLIDSGVANPSQVNGNTFKTSTNLNELPQIKTLNKITEIAPFWGDADICQFGINRLDFDLTAEANIKIEPTAIFMGSIITTADDDALKTNCKPKNNTGNLCELISGPGQILSIRQTIFPDNQNLPILEEHSFEQNGKIIDGDGSFLTKVPMNLDFIITNEFGQQVLSNDTTKGIPTKGKYRFKFKFENEQGLQNEFLRANFLVPNIKEHGWSSSSNDPFDPTTAVPLIITLPVGTLTGTTTITQTGGLLFENTINSSNFSVVINGQPYFGDTGVIPVIAGDIVQIISNPIDDTQLQDINFKFLPQDYFDVLRSYSFSLDWDDYADTQSAIDCEDTFYEFHYNKVYTTSMFLDRYKNGLGRAKHLGIKEIDNRTCKTTVNTFPVNDAIRNFDFIFFVFNILITILTFPILVLLFVAHLISFMWPILKYVLIFVGIYLTYTAGVALVDSIQTGIQTINTGIAAVTNAGLALEFVRLILYTVYTIGVAAFKLAMALAFLAFAVVAALRIKGFPRIGLPMLSYPECTSCDCKCGNAEMDDDFDETSIQNQIDSNNNNNTTIAQSNSFLAPINLSQTYVIDHPNFENRPGFDVDQNSKGWFNDTSTGGSTDYNYRSLLNRFYDQEITAEVVAQSAIDFRRLFSGWDDLSTPNKPMFKSPEFFLFGAEKVSGSNNDKRWFAKPTKQTYPQRLNEFNTRDKYFNGVNQITTTVNTSLGSQPFNDQPLVLLVKKGTTNNLGVGEIFSFVDPKKSNGQINITGATLNQFGLNSVTGTTITGTTTYPITYANPSNPSVGLTANIQIVQTGNTENQVQFLPDIEYFQIITGMTIGDYENISESINVNTTLYHSAYLKHKISYSVYNNNGNTLSTPPTSATTEDSFGDVVTKQVNNYTAIETIADYKTEYEIIVVVRGVDPYTQKQTIKYDLSKIFGYSTTNPNTVIEGQYYINWPIQPGSLAPNTHNTIDNNITTKVYFNSLTFTPSVDYSGFTSNNPYYYISTDDNTMLPYTLGGQNYQPVNNANPLSFFTSPGTQYSVTLNPSRILPLPPSNIPYYIGGGSFIGINTNISTGNLYINNVTDSEVGWPFNNNSLLRYTMYSAAYYRYTNTGELPGVNFSNRNNIIMRSDRLPTSSCVEDGFNNRTGYGLHQNNNFCYYKKDGQTSNPTQSVASDLPSGEGFDNELIGLTQTLNCDNMVSLNCYSGTGTNVGIVPDGQCVRKKIRNDGTVVDIVFPKDVVVNGCYCLLNKDYLKEYGNDAALFLEWKTRFTITFATCRGVFAQTFQNNWVNGVLYMFSFNKTATYPINNPNNPTYNYCSDVIVYNDINNGFYYRSSPWDGNDFIGKNSPTIPTTWPSVLVNDYPGTGYNTKQIQFPTTIVDMGPREKFISEICNNNNFNSYYVDNIKSTSYQDLSDVIQIGFLSRLLNDNFRQSILPISNPAGDNTEGKGIIQFFNSTRQGDRIDGDFAQMFSINSEWKISPFLSENYPNPDSIFFGNDTQSQQRPVFGVFYEVPQINDAYRKNLTPGLETLNYSPLLQYYYGYPKTQEVPFYKWTIESQSGNIFGNENNNWDTTGPFYKRGYQDLEFTNNNEYYQTSTTQLGYLTNFDLNGDPQPLPNNSGNYVVGAPFHFYFGLNNGKTAIDKFVKLYVNTEE